MILRGGGNRKGKRQWRLEDLVLPKKKKLTGRRSSRKLVMPLAEPQAWLPAPMISGEPLMDDASIRDFNGGIGCHVASALEQTLLLPKDMVELQGFRRNEVFLHTKRFSGMVCTYFSIAFFFFI